MMRGVTFSVGVLLVTLGSLAAVGAEADEAAHVFESLYGKELQRVRATAAASDDLALAERLLAAAEQAKATPSLCVLLLETAADLAEGHADGQGVAIRALEALAQADPAKAASAAERTLAIRQKQFAAAKGEAKTAAGEALIDVLLAEAKAAEEADDPVGATALLRRAQSAARSIQSGRAADIDGRLAAMAHAAQTARAVAMFRERLQEDASDQEAREKLVRLLLVDCNRPARAAEYVAGLEDEALRENVPAAAKPLADLPEAQYVPLGDWYRGLAEQAPEPAKAAMFARAATYYERFLQVHTSEDLQRTAATLALEKVRSAMAKLGGAPPAEAATASAVVPSSGVIRPGQWVELLPLVSLPADVVSGTWKRKDDALSITEAGKETVAMLPIVPHGSYELQVVFARTSGKELVAWLLPMGEGRGVCLTLSEGGGRASGLELVRGQFANTSECSVKPGVLENGKAYTLHVKVLMGRDEVTIAATLDGKPYLQWQGPASALALHDAWRLPHAGCPGLRSYECVDYRRVRFRMLSGAARLLRPPGSDTKATGPASPEAPAEKPSPMVLKPGTWVDLVPRIDIQRDVKGGAWKCQDGELLLLEGYWSHLQLPAVPRGSYELQIAFTRTGGRQDLPVHLPVGASSVMLNMNRENSAGLGLINGKHAHENASSVHYGKRLTNNVRHTLHVKVAVRGGTAAIEGRLEGPDKRLVRWQGPISALSPGEKHQVIDGRALGLGAHQARITYHSVRLKMLSGEALLP